MFMFWPSDEEKQQIVDGKNIEQRAKKIADHPFIKEKFDRLQAKLHRVIMMIVGGGGLISQPCQPMSLYVELLVLF
jgi:hypothetical protein